MNTYIQNKLDEFENEFNLYIDNFDKTQGMGIYRIDVRASVCGYCGRLLGKDNYPNPTIQSIDFKIPENAEKVEGSCCIAKERLGSF